MIRNASPIIIDLVVFKIMGMDLLVLQDGRILLSRDSFLFTFNRKGYPLL